MKKNIIFHVTRQYMKLNRKRTLLTFLGIALMVMLMTCAFAGKDTALAYMEKLGSLKEESWHVAVYNADQEKIEKINELDYVGETAYSVDYKYTDFVQSANPERPLLFVKAYSDNDFDWMNISLAEGRLPQNGGEIVISSAAVEDGADIAVGDRISADFFDRTLEATGYNGVSVTVLPFYGVVLDVEAGPVVVGKDMCWWGDYAPEIREGRIPLDMTAEYTVVGFIDPPGFEDAASAVYIALTHLDDPDALESCNITLKYDRTAKSGGFERTTELYDITSGSDIEFNNYVLSFSGLSSDRTINILSSGAVIFFVILIMLASVLLIYNLFQISLDERSRWLGQLSTIGATRRQKRSSIYYECFTLLAAAVPAGIALGIGLIYFGMRMLKPALGVFAGLERFTDQCPIKLVFSWKAILLVILMSCVTVLLSAFIPARRVGKIGPIESIRGTDSTVNAEKYVIDAKEIGKVSPEVWLAHLNVKRQLKNNSGIVRAASIFMVILMVVGFAADMVSRVTNTVLGYEEKPEYYADADYILSSYTEDKTTFDSMVSTLSHEPSITSLVEFQEAPWAGMTDASVLSKEYKDIRCEMLSLFLGHYPSEEEYEQYFTSTMVDYLLLDDGSYNALAKKAGAIEQTDENAIPVLFVADGYTSTDYNSFGGKKAEQYKYFDIKQMTDLAAGESFTVSTMGIEENLPTYDVEITGFVTSQELNKYAERFNPDEILLIINHDSMNKLKAAGVNTGEMFTASCIVTLDDSDPALKARLDGMTDSSSEDFGVISLEHAASLSEAIAKIVRILLISFVVVVSVICLINLGNSVKSRMVERRQEFAAMRSIGITDNQLRKQLITECAGHIILSTAVAAVLSAILIALVFTAMNNAVGRLVFSMPWLSILLALVISAAAVCIFTLVFFPMHKKESLIEAIRRSSI